jgi:hypothetical protein
MQVVVGCKADLEEQREVPDYEAADWAHLHHGEYFLTSSKIASNVDEAFESLVRAVRRLEAEKEGKKPAKDAKRFLQRTNCIMQ